MHGTEGRGQGGPPPGVRDELAEHGMKAFGRTKPPLTVRREPGGTWARKHMGQTWPRRGQTWPDGARRQMGGNKGRGRRPVPPLNDKTISNHRPSASTLRNHARRGTAPETVAPGGASPRRPSPLARHSSTFPYRKSPGAGPGPGQTAVPGAHSPAISEVGGVGPWAFFHRPPAG